MAFGWHCGRGSGLLPYLAEPVEVRNDMRTKSPLTEWREQYGLSVAELADLCNVTSAQIARIEAGKTGLVGEVQDYLTTQGANVSMMAAGHSAFLAALRGEEVDEDAPTGPWLLGSDT